MRIIKRTMAIGICLCLCFTLISCSNTDKQTISNIINESVNSEEVQSIKALTLDGTDITLGALIDTALGSPTYELYDPAEDGNRYVTIKGNVEYAGKPVVAALQYKDVGDDQYEFYALEYNGVPQNDMEISAFFDFLFQEYQKEHGPAEETETPEVVEADNKESSNYSDYEAISYNNSRFGYHVSYPASWGELQESQNGDGGYLYNTDNEQILVYASYMMESSFREYLDNYYDGWEIDEFYVDGAAQSVKAIYYGEESCQTAVIAEKDGVIYTLRRITIYIEADGSMEDGIDLQRGYDQAEESFSIL